MVSSYEGELVELWLGGAEFVVVSSAREPETPIRISKEHVAHTLRKFLRLGRFIHYRDLVPLTAIRISSR